MSMKLEIEEKGHNITETKIKIDGQEIQDHVTAFNIYSSPEHFPSIILELYINELYYTHENINVDVELDKIPSNLKKIIYEKLRIEIENSQQEHFVK